MKGRKLLSAVIAGAMVLGTMSFPAFAASDTLPEAVDGVITLTEDVKLGSDFDYNANGGSLTIDLAGYSLKLTGNTILKNGVYTIKNGTVDVENVECTSREGLIRIAPHSDDSATLNMDNVTVKANGYNAQCGLFQFETPGKLNLNKVTINAANVTDGYGVFYSSPGNPSSLTMNEVTMTVTGANKLIYGCNAVITDSNISAQVKKDVFSAVSPVITDSTLTVEAGRAVFNDANVFITTATVINSTITPAGTLTSGIVNNTNASSKIILDSVSDIGTIEGVCTASASIGSNLYSSLADALAAAQDGDTIDLLDNTIELDGQTTIDKDITIINGTFDITDAVCTTEGIIYIDNKTVEFNNVDFVGSNFTSAFGVIFANHNANVTLDSCDFTLKNDRAPLGGTLKGNDNASFTVKNCTFDLENPSRVLTNIKLDMSDTTINAYVTDSTRVAGDLNNHAFRNVYGKIKDSTIDVTGTETGLKNTDSGSLLITGKSNVSFTNTVDANIYLNDENEILTVEPPANVIGDIVYETVSERVLTDKITVNFVPTANENVYDIVLDGNYKEIYKFVSAEIQFVNAGNGYEIDGTDDINVSPNTENDDRYGFYLKDGTLDNRITATKIKIGTVTFPAYGTINFKVDANNSKVVATEYNTHHEKYYTEADANAKLTADENGINSTIAAPSIPVGSGGTGAVSFIVDFRTNGGSIVSSVKVKKGEKVIRPEDPTKEGYTFGGWFTDEALKKEYDFDTKVQKKLVLYAKWIEEAAVEPEPELPVFTDVKETDWFYESVMTAFKKGLMNGVSETEFAPDTTLTRAMLVTILYRAEGEPATNRSIPFADVDMGAYYANAVSWAKQNGIVSGVTENEFAPDTNITREQIATIIFRYAQYKGMDAVTLEENLHFTDADEISEYAVSAMNWAVGTGLMKGKSTTTINPKDNATRAEIAAILQRFIETNK